MSKMIGKQIYHFNEVNSTQAIAKKLAERGKPEGTVVIAERQKKGRGRLKRKWASPPGGIYLSVILRPCINPRFASLIPLAIVIACTKAIKNLGIKAKIKWPNDVLVDGEKICGILSEIKLRGDVVDWIVVGIGINANATPEGVSATSLCKELGREISINLFIKKLLAEIERSYNKLVKKEFLQVIKEWKELSNTLGRAVTIKTQQGLVNGISTDIDELGRLVVRLKDSSLKKIAAGDCLYLRQRSI